jgi:hypothetical protein
VSPAVAGERNGPSPAPTALRLPPARFVDRVDFLCGYTRRKAVIDLGFVDEARMSSKRELGTWLHEKIAQGARQTIGIDADEAGVELARELGYAAYAADCESRESLERLGLERSEVVLAGELIEHLDRPGAFLEAVDVLLAHEGSLVITTPNACSITNVIGSLTRRELVNPDHVGWYSWHTLRTLLGRHGWQIIELAYYGFPKIPTLSSASTADRVRARAFNAYQVAARPLFRLRPAAADGIVAVATRA